MLGHPKDRGCHSQKSGESLPGCKPKILSFCILLNTHKRMWRKNNYSLVSPRYLVPGRCSVNICRMDEWKRRHTRAQVFDQSDDKMPRCGVAELPCPGLWDWESRRRVPVEPHLPPLAAPRAGPSELGTRFPRSGLQRRGKGALTGLSHVLKDVVAHLYPHGGIIYLERNAQIFAAPF